MKLPTYALAFACMPTLAHGVIPAPPHCRADSDEVAAAADDDFGQAKRMSFGPAAPTLPTFRSNSLPNSSFSSISRPPRRLGLVIPDYLITIADEVIE
jgi:hypothetical protein